MHYQWDEYTTDGTIVLLKVSSMGPSRPPCPPPWPCFPRYVLKDSGRFWKILECYVPSVPLSPPNHCTRSLLNCLYRPSLWTCLHWSRSFNN